MKTIEEQIWEYIDGELSGKDREAIAKKIADDNAYATVYVEMLELHHLMATVELEEPSMSFTRNTMDKVNLEMPPSALKTKVDKRIIYSLTAIFLVAIVSVSWFAIAHTNFPALSLPSLSLPTFNFSIDVKQFVSPLTLQIFFFVDILLALLYLDRLYRSKKA
ncbi:zf-HC2 domain-containing protein [Pedobacter immunditicola]|uniref:zf-HC2 domain-containing protein n=1 Tax=Pedobacter immunditicola TaxID=3133440 RepID=UPI0030AE327B